MIKVYLFASHFFSYNILLKNSRKTCRSHYFVLDSLPWDPDSVSEYCLIRRPYEFSSGILQCCDVVGNVPIRLDQIFGVWDVRNPINRRSVSYRYRDKR